MMASAPIFVVAGVVRDEATGKLLLTRRPPEVHLGGFWEFPGGKIEPGESPQVALARELEEEVGVRVRVESLICETTHAYPERTVSIQFYECRVITGRPRIRGVDALVWCTPEELVHYPMPEANAGIVEELTRRPG